MVGELLNEIMSAIGVQAFNFNLNETTDRLRDFIEREKYFMFVARGEDAGAVGFVALYESHALYAEGAFGTIPELFVRPEFRSQNVGLHLVEQAKFFGNSLGWKRLEVTTPPLPQFDKTLAFYGARGFCYYWRPQTKGGAVSCGLTVRSRGTREKRRAPQLKR